MNALARIRDFAAKGRGQEQCALCSEPIGGSHPHLFEVALGKLVCSCAGCAAAFNHASGKFRKVPDRAAKLADFRMTDAQWQAFGIPVGIAFLVRSTPRGGVVSFYPSPLGAVESLVSPEAWEAVLARNPALRSLEPDVEALLVRGRECFIAPIDRCYALIGLMRRDWRGMTGGDEVSKSVDRFFEELA